MHTIALPKSAVSAAPTARGSRLIELIASVVSFEVVFVLFLFAGQYKADPRFDWLPMDATLLFGLINFAQGLFLIGVGKVRPNPSGVPMAIAGVIFAAYVIASTGWAAGVYYAQYKAAYIATIGMWCLCAGSLVISSSQQRLTRFLVALMMFSAWIGIECMLFYSHQSQFGQVMQLHAMAGESAYIGLGRVVTCGGVLCAVLWMFPQTIRWPLWRSRAVSFGMMAAFAVIGAMIGARGPIVAAVLAIAMVGMLYSDSRTTRRLAQNAGRLSLVGVLIAGAILVQKARTGEYPLIVKRCLAFTASSEHYDATGQSHMRLEIFAEAIRGWTERPLLGHGIGGFSVVWNNSDVRLFPHNLILELLCELGVVGLALFALIAIAGVHSNRVGWSQTPAGLKAMVLALAGSAFLNTMTSGDLPDNRLLLFMLGLLAFRAPAVQAYPATQRPRAMTPAPLAFGDRRRPIQTRHSVVPRA